MKTEAPRVEVEVKLTATVPNLKLAHLHDMARVWQGELVDISGDSVTLQINTSDMWVEGPKK